MHLLTGRLFSKDSGVNRTGLASIISFREADINLRKDGFNSMTISTSPKTFANLHLVLMSIAGFPKGTGATARLYTYACGFLRLGVIPHIICLTAPSDANTPCEGEFDGIRYTYLQKYKSGKQNRLVLIVNILTSLPALFHILIRLYRSGKLDAILYYSPEHFPYVITAWLAARATRVPFIGERTEHPFTGQGFRQKTIGRRVFESFVYRLFDGYIVISQYLFRYVQPRLRRGAWLEKVPIIVDGDTYKDAAKAIFAEKIVAYCGSIGSDLEPLIMAFSLATKFDQEWSLMIIGDTMQARRKSLDALIAQCDLTGRVIFTGPIGRKEMPTTLARADIMVLPRASGLFSTAGFPTKLGEYLATGRPVIVTATGDIPNYLTDAVNAYLVPPDDVDAFATKLRLVMQNPSDAELVGKRGQETAKQQFDYLYWCRIILERLWDTP